MAAVLDRMVVPQSDPARLASPGSWQQEIALMHDEAYRLIPLRARDGSVRAEVKVDAEDYDALAPLRWSVVDGDGPRPYAVRRERGADGRLRHVAMHRVITGLPYGDPRQVDHINRDTLDNRRANLRVVTRAQNRQNVVAVPETTSRFRGVSWSKKRKAWCATAGLGGRLHWLGYHPTEQRAARVAEAFRVRHMTHAAQDTMTRAEADAILCAAEWAPRGKLTDADVMAIRILRLSTSIPGYEIAAMFGVSKSAVSLILRGQDRPLTGGPA